MGTLDDSRVKGHRETDGGKPNPRSFRVLICRDGDPRGAVSRSLLVEDRAHPPQRSEEVSNAPRLSVRQG